MTLRIAIQADKVIHKNGEQQSFSERWTALARAQGIETVPVDVFSNDVLSRIATCDAFMWRFPPTPFPRVMARRILYAVEAGMGLPVFPSFNTAWHVEDKIGQTYFLSAAGIPTPSTEISWTREQAEKYCNRASYPFVIKLSTGYQGSNVRLIQTRGEAMFYVKQLFSHGLVGLGYRPASRGRLLLRRVRAAREIVRGRSPFGAGASAELQGGYLYAQQFLPDNGFDIRVTTIGHRAFAFRRLNRPGDFRASGSGRIDWDPGKIDEASIRLAFDVARKTRAQTIAVDIIRRGDEPVIVELNLTYASWAVRDCPGHWTLKGETQTGELVWKNGSMRPEDAIFSDFLVQIQRSRNVGIRA
jgi:glutathione synthase/RimK-type ligase-like ATP-grasp enzyme